MNTRSSSALWSYETHARVSFKPPPMAPLSGMHKSANSITSLLGVVYHTAPNISYTLYLCPGPWGALRCRASVQGLACGGGAWQWGAVGGSDGGVNSVEQRQELKEADDVQLHPTCVSSLAWVRIMLFVVFARATVCAQARERGGGRDRGREEERGKEKGRGPSGSSHYQNINNHKPFQQSAISTFTLHCNRPQKGQDRQLQVALASQLAKPQARQPRTQWPHTSGSAASSWLC